MVTSPLPILKPLRTPSNLLGPGGLALRYAWLKLHELPLLGSSVEVVNVIKIHFFDWTPYQCFGRCQYKKVIVPAFMTSRSLKSSSPNSSSSKVSAFVVMVSVETLPGGSMSLFLFVICRACFCNNEGSNEPAGSSGLSSADRVVPAVV